MQPTRKYQIEINPTSLNSISLNQLVPTPNSDLLLKSKSYLDKLDNRINEAINNRVQCGTNIFGYNSRVFSKDGGTGDKNIIRSIDDMTRSIKHQIQTKIEHNFQSILNQQKRLGINDMVPLQPKNKEQAVKKLIKDYWQKQENHDYSIHKNKPNKQKQNILPRLNPIASSTSDPNNESSKKQVISSLNVKNYEKNRLKMRESQKEKIKKHKEEKILAYLYSYMLQVVDYKVQNHTPEFLLFQKMNYKKWHEIEGILEQVQQFSRQYQINYCTLDLQKVMLLIDSKAKPWQKNSSFKHSSSNNIDQQSCKSIKQADSKKIINFKKPQYTLHELLGCFEDCEEISFNNRKKPGIRFYGNKGKMRAIIKIQAAWRGYLTNKKVKELKRLSINAKKIQAAYRLYRTYCSTKQQILENNLKKYSWFTQKQRTFSSQYRVLELTKQKKYQLHICSDSQNQWQRISTQKFVEKQNGYITRIFKAFLSNKEKLKEYQTRQIRIIFVTALPITGEVLNYYYKLLELGGAADFRNRVTFLAVDECQSMLQRLPLARVMYYCPKVMKKLKQLIKDQYAYLVPSSPSPDYIQLCHILNIPLYSASPQPLMYLQTNSGCKNFIKHMSDTKEKITTQTVSNESEDSTDHRQSYLPNAKNIYSLPVFINELALLIQAYPYVSRWMLKIDNEHSSRGLASLQINKILPKQMVAFLRKSFIAQNISPRNPICPQIRQLSKQIISILHSALTDPQYQYINIISTNIYRTNKQYLDFYFANGGIIQADIEFKGKLASGKNCQTQIDLCCDCFCVQIQPDFQWKFVTQFRKVVSKMKVVGCYYQQDMIQPPLQIQRIVKELIKKKYFGYFVLDFMKPNNSLIPTLNSIKCYLDIFSSSCFLQKFLSKDSNMLYLPYIPHDNIKKMTMTTFFHLCRLQNISFDIERKIGNIFVFLDGLESGCLGMLTFNDKSKVETFIHAAEVLDFLNGKIDIKIGQGHHEEFLTIRNCINGYLKSLRKKKLALKTNTESLPPKHKLPNYKQKDYLL